MPNMIRVIQPQPNLVNALPANIRNEFVHEINHDEITSFMDFMIESHQETCLTHPFETKLPHYVHPEQGHETSKELHS